MRKLVVGGLLGVTFLLAGCGGGTVTNATVSIGTSSSTAAASVVSTATHTAVATTSPFASVDQATAVVDGFVTALYGGDSGVYREYADPVTAPMDQYFRTIKLDGKPVVKSVAPQPNGLTLVQVVVPSIKADGSKVDVAIWVNLRANHVLTYNSVEL